MTENECINKIKWRIDIASAIAGDGEDGKAFEDLEMAIQALEEIQQYRAIGTVEEFKDLKNTDIPIIHGKAELDLHDKEVRNKAIDDFVNLFIEEDSKHILDYNYYETIREVAEQLKGEKQ